MSVARRRQAEKQASGGIDSAVPRSARVWHYWLGGKDYFPVDREAGDMVLARFPGTADAVRQLRYFTARAVRYLAAEAGIRQFLDMGAGLPFRDPVHEIALSIAPDCRIAYADCDPLVLAFARALLTGPPGAVTCIDADLRRPAGLLAAARGCLDLTQPTAILLTSVLGHIGHPAAMTTRPACWSQRSSKTRCRPAATSSSATLSPARASTRGWTPTTPPALRPTAPGRRSRSPACSTDWTSPAPRAPPAGGSPSPALSPSGRRPLGGP